MHCAGRQKSASNQSFIDADDPHVKKKMALGNARRFRAIYGWYDSQMPFSDSNSSDKYGE